MTHPPCRIVTKDPIAMEIQQKAGRNLANQLDDQLTFTTTLLFQRRVIRWLVNDRRSVCLGRGHSMTVTVIVTRDSNGRYDTVQSHYGSPVQSLRVAARHEDT